MTVVLLDANNLAMRSFHAAKHSMTSADGTETGSLQLFIGSLSRYLFELRPTKFVACWDGGGQTFRHRLYPAYKEARRAGQPVSTITVSGEISGPLLAFAMIHAFLDLVGIAQWSQPGVEADDLIAAAWRRHHDIDQVVIMSSDKDLLQLLDANTSQLRFSSANAVTDLWTHERVIADFGYTPEQIPLMMALTGDAIDGVPGAKGIGPKKALKLLQAHEWDLDEAARERADCLMIHLSRDLVDLLTEDHCVVPDVPDYEPLTVHSPNAVERLEAVAYFCAQYQLVTIWDRLVAGHLW